MRDQSGSVTVEFAILLPVFLVILTGLFWLALYLMTISDVQQLALEIARQALQYSGDALSQADLCDDVEQELLQALADTFSLIRPEYLGSPTCSASAQTGWNIIQLSYDLSYMGFSSVFSTINGGSSEIVGQAVLIGR
ncbi:hypothetical protein GCM10011415_03940 [Salipiger pallidus]|uniref:TadE-like domain-containing protein n=1 Tax=Salipiger pallidus TaxID=1775170 RepID=A0A8J3EEU7_9RHOB|nr:hypothetical protein GCM10011415_03940 [Salipiger pallidus]